MLRRSCPRYAVRCLITPSHSWQHSTRATRTFGRRLHPIGSKKKLPPSEMPDPTTSGSNARNCESDESDFTDRLYSRVGRRPRS